jgi:hypothetical protein
LKSGPDFLNTQQPFAFHHAIAAASKDLLPKTKKNRIPLQRKTSYLMMVLSDALH